ncbi:MAG: glycosyltransferase family 2 protein [Devosia sp.]|nr:glycosyltransferase family 2 protein [Devosia sp.]
MAETVAIVTPAYLAERWIGTAVRSVLAQSYPHWQHWIVADDGLDYEALLAAAGLRDPRLKFLASGTIGGGASRARNAGLDAIGADYVAVLDADDAFRPDKLARAVAALEHHAIVSVALDERTPAGAHLRFVGEGPDTDLPASRYKWVNLSMDSMIVWDRRRTDGRYDPDLVNMNDLDFLLRLFARATGTWHLGTPLHDYLKLDQSLSNGPGVTATMIRSKQEILSRLETGFYPMADPAGVEGMAKFLGISLCAEAAYPAALAARPGLLFEDHLEPMLRAEKPLSA